MVALSCKKWSSSRFVVSILSINSRRVGEYKESL